MPWQEVSTMSLRQEFITMVQHGTVPFSELCRRFQVSRKTGYKWLARFTAHGTAGLADRSRRPHGSPRPTPVDGRWAVYFCHHRVTEIDLRSPDEHS